MKIFTAFVLASSAILSACSADGIFTQTIEGSGKVVHSDRKIQSFNTIVIESAYSVVYESGAENNVSIDADDNIIDYITTEVKDGVLTLDFKDKGYSHASITIKVTGKASHFIVSGSGDITCTTPINSPVVSASIQGSGNVSLMNITSDTLKLDIGGSGSITTKGVAQAVTADIEGSGDIHAFDATALDVRADIDGSGTIEVQASRKLDASISGSGDVIYTGNPAVAEHISGSGTVRKR